MSETPILFTPLRLRDLELKNRVVVSPMATYSARDGHATDEVDHRQDHEQRCHQARQQFVYFKENINAYTKIGGV